MAKKEKVKKEFNAEEAQKRMDKYNKAVQSEKNGKRTVISILGGVVLIFFILLVILLKMNGVGTTIVFDSEAENNTTSISAHTEKAEDVQGTNLAEYVADQIAG